MKRLRLLCLALSALLLASLYQAAYRVGDAARDLDRDFYDAVTEEEQAAPGEWTIGEFKTED